MFDFRSVIGELQGALQSGSPGKRTEALLHVTELFTRPGEQIPEQHVAVFDDVLNFLVNQIEQEALTELSARLSRAVKAPPRIIRKLAAHDSIDIAGPILQKSEQLTEQDLVEIAKTKSHAHQLTIAGRAQVPEAVTEVLLDRGNSEVVHKVASNDGARFSNSGFSKLILLASGDDDLTSTVAGRSDLPPPMFRQVLTHASAAVREKLLAAAPPEKRENLQTILNEISSQVGSGVITRHYAKAQQFVRTFSQDTARTKLKLFELARDKKLDETVATLAALTAVPIDLVDRLFYSAQPHAVMVLCKLMALDWNVTAAVLRARSTAVNTEADALAALEGDYRSLTPPVAQRLVRFWQSRNEVPAVTQRPRDAAALSA
ncbi:MAG TPA: DUF2336 domain-containing protein [Pseudolabrys sp.]|nr:DUF2336 domain-containing protein [Pseudolabrys sp.]